MLDVGRHFLSSGFVADGAVIGFESVGLMGAVTPGFDAPPSAVVSSELQPLTNPSARTRLESIVQVLIPDFTLTDALLENTKQGKESQFRSPS
jgi:hypothetical protein